MAKQMLSIKHITFNSPQKVLPLAITEFSGNHRIAVRLLVASPTTNFIQQVCGIDSTSVHGMDERLSDIFTLDWWLARVNPATSYGSEACKIIYRFG